MSNTSMAFFFDVLSLRCSLSNFHLAVDLSQVPYGYIPGTYVAYSMLAAFGSILGMFWGSFLGIDAYFSFSHPPFSEHPPSHVVPATDGGNVHIP